MISLDCILCRAFCGFVGRFAAFIIFMVAGVEVADGEVNQLDFQRHKDVLGLSCLVGDFYEADNAA